MQYLQIKSNTTLLDLINLVGARNVDSVLAANFLTRQPNIGIAYKNLYIDKTGENIEIVDSQRKNTILNTMTSDADVFETAALLNEKDWKFLSNIGALPGTLRIPETVILPDSVDIIGNREPVKRTIYDKAMLQLQSYGKIDPAIFNEYSTRNAVTIADTVSSSNTTKWFKLPWGLISLYSSISGKMVDFPVFPEELDDSIKANYDQMPDMIYQYEPWQIYKSSGPRFNTYTFNMHRDMWSGDHRDGKCNELIRFCEANCYPEFKGAAVQTATVTLYIAGKPLISGIMNEVSVHWDGPIGIDNFYLHCKLELSITEVSKDSLNYTKVVERGLI